MLNTNKITLVLTYAVLEWVLIFLLLLNSLFSYLIIKFANFFGLQPPCLLCSRIDHIFDHQNLNGSDLLCDVHARPISELGYCSARRESSESRETCGDRLSVSGNGNRVVIIDKEREGRGCISVFVNEKNNHKVFDKSVQDYVEEDARVRVSSDEHLEFFVDDSGRRLVRVESIDSITEESRNKDNAVLDVDLNEEPEFGIEDEDGNSPIFHAENGHSMEINAAEFYASPTNNIRSLLQLDLNEIEENSLDDQLKIIERLKSELREERNNLESLYLELEEERSASAVAANQTMAMINRLQDEKAAMQMEAFQYHRMMEEQSEYDQEALYTLNQVVMKREKEKHEIEKELELCRKKLLDYETREKTRRVLKKSSTSSSRSSGFFSSPCCSNSEESDGFSADLNEEAKEESLADFEEDEFEDVGEISRRH
ncbi:hypothetical protein ABFS82_12G065500 [Erythranthe guttata]|uniref:myosin-binding protein 3 isoform X2 n=1 Tax=Erythranthe guttata TaxID=4155 RepID=UPI00064DCAC0|nr:PREDICTED: myosin-binding protein 3 isoform X2 [Erythranthe guttata]|eukprot:XP_012842551.1 PREDICTED: myosin-binding protein 3 isoform X2 [Erythranthe guttata]